MSHTISSDRTEPLPQRLLNKAVDIRPYEVRVVTLSMLYFFFVFGSYSVVKPVRDAMGTVYGMPHIQELFTVTFLVSLILAPLYSALASRMRLSTFLPWVYGFIVVTILIFFGLFQSAERDRSVAAAFYVWVSTFNILTISVFWSFMADMFSRAQASRLFGFIAAGGTAGGVAGPAIATLLAKSTGNNGLILVSAVGFAAAAALVMLLAKEKQRLVNVGGETQHTTLDHRLPGTTLDAITLLFRSRYLLLIAVFLLLMTWISTVVYIQLGELITKSFTDRAARTQAYATIDLTVNSITLFLQLFGTGRLIKRFGVTTGLMVNPVIMILAFIAIAFAPVLLLLGGIQALRRVAEYAIAKPTREMLFTVVDQESKYKAKNVIDTVLYRFGDLSSAWVSSFILPFGAGGLAIFGAVIAVLWFPVAYALGRRYESSRPPERPDTAINEGDVSRSEA